MRGVSRERGREVVLGEREEREERELSLLLSLFGTERARLWWVCERVCESARDALSVCLRELQQWGSARARGRELFSLRGARAPNESRPAAVDHQSGFSAAPPVVSFFFFAAASANCLSSSAKASIEAAAAERGGGGGGGGGTAAVGPSSPSRRRAVEDACCCCSSSSNALSASRYASHTHTRQPDCCVVGFFGWFGLGMAISGTTAPTRARQTTERRTTNKQTKTHHAALLARRLARGVRVRLRG